MGSVGKLSVVLSARVRGMLANLQKAESAMVAVRERMSSVAAGAARMAAAFTAATAVFTMSAARFERDMTRVAAIAAGTKERFGVAFKTMSAEALRLAQTTQYTTSEVAGGMQFLAMSGMDAANTISAMPAVLQLAASAGVDLATAADTVTNVMAGFGVTTDALTKAMERGEPSLAKYADATEALKGELASTNNVLVATFTGANTSLTQLGAGFRKVGPASKLFNVSIEDTSAALGILGNAGIQAEEAGTGLRRAMVSLQSASPKVRKALGDLGLQSTDLAKKGLPFVVAQLERTQKAYEAVGKETEFNTTLFEAFGLRAGPIMGAMLNQGTEALVKLRARIEAMKEADIAGFLQEQQLATFAGQFDLLKSAVDGFAQALGGELLVVMKPIMKAAKSFFDVIASTPKPILRVAAVLLVLASGAFIAVAGLAAVGVASMTAGMGLSTFGQIAPKVTFWLAAMGPGGKEAAVGVTSLGKAFGIAATRVATMAVAAAPILILLALLGVLALFVRSRFEKGFGDFAAFFAPVVDVISQIPEALAGVVSMIGGIIGGLLSPFSAVAAAIGAVWDNLLGVIASLVGQRLVGRVLGAMATIREVLASVPAVAAKAWRQLVSTAVPILKHLGNTLAEIPMQLFDVLGTIPEVFGRVFGELVSTLGRIFEPITAAFSSFWQTIVDGAGVIWDVLSSVAGRIFDVWVSAWSFIGEVVMSVFGGIVDAAFAAFDGVSSGLSQIAFGFAYTAKEGWKTWDDAFAGIETIVTGVFKVIGSAIDWVFAGFVELGLMIPTVFSKIASIITGLLDDIINSPFFGAIAERLGLDADAAKQWSARVNQSTQDVRDNIAQLKKDLKDTASVRAAIDGIEAESGGVLGFMGEILDPTDFVAAIKGQLADLFGEGGEDMGDAFAKRMEELIAKFSKGLQGTRAVVPGGGGGGGDGGAAAKARAAAHDALTGIIKRETEARQKLASKFPNFTSLIQQNADGMKEIQDAMWDAENFSDVQQAIDAMTGAQRERVIEELKGIKNSKDLAAAMKFVEENADALGVVFADVKGAVPKLGFDDITADPGTNVATEISRGLFNKFDTGKNSEQLKGVTDDMGNALTGLITNGDLGGVLQSGFGALLGDPMIAGTIVQGLKTVFDVVSGAVTAIFDGVASLIPEQRLSGAVSEVGGAVGVIAGVLAVAGLLLGVFVGAIGQVALMLAPLAILLAALALPITILTVVVSLAVAAILTAVGIVVSAILGFLLGPIIMLGLGLMTLLGLFGVFLVLIKETEAFADMMKAMGAALDEFLAPLSDTLRPALMALAGLFSYVLQALAPLFQHFADGLMTLFPTLFDVAKLLASAFIDLVIVAMHVGNGLIDIIQFFAPVIGGVVGAFGLMLDAFLAGADAVFGLAALAFDLLLMGDQAEAARAAQAFVAGVGNAADGVEDAINGVVSDLDAFRVGEDVFSEMRGMQDLINGMMWQQFAMEGERLLVTEEATEALRDMNEAAVNVPQGMKVALDRWRAISTGGIGDVVPGASDGVGTGSAIAGGASAGTNVQIGPFEEGAFEVATLEGFLEIMRGLFEEWAQNQQGNPLAQQGNR